MMVTSTLSFFAGFKCQSCTRCCQGTWDVLINENDYRTLELIVKNLYGRKKVPQYLERLEAHRDPNVYGKIIKKSDTRCVFLDKKDNLCTVHKEFGHDALPVSCKTFPRSRLRVASEDQYTLSATCPTVRGLIADAGEVKVVPKAIELDRHYPGMVSEAGLGELSLKNRKLTTGAYLHLKKYLVELANDERLTSLEELLLCQNFMLEQIDNLPAGDLIDESTLANLIERDLKIDFGRIASTAGDFAGQKKLILTWLDLRKSVGQLDPSEMVVLYSFVKDSLVSGENADRFVQTYRTHVTPFLNAHLSIVKNYLAAKLWFDPSVVGLDLFTFLPMPCFIAACLLRYLLTKKFMDDGKITKDDLLRAIEVIDENSLHVAALLKGLPEGFKQRPIALDEIIRYIRI